MVSTESLIRICTKSASWIRQNYTRPADWLYKYYPENILFIGGAGAIASHVLSNGVPELYLVRNIGLIVTGMATADYAVSRMKQLSHSTINKIGVVGRTITATTIAVLLWYNDPYKDVLKNLLYTYAVCASVSRRIL